MTSAAIEWRATNLVALGEELQSKVARVTQQFEERASRAKDGEEAARLRQRLGQLVDSIQQSYRVRLEKLSSEESTSSESLYDRSLAGIDMDLLVYRGDKKALAELLADASFSSTVNRLLAELKPHNARKELLTKALKLTRSMMPGLYAVTDRCAQTLKLGVDIEVYVNQDSRFNAACYPPVKEKVLLMVTSALIEKFSEEELRFVIGHELGHYLFEHTRFPVEYILQNHGGNLSPLHAMRMYAWIRNAEITADRVGMVCCRDFDVAAKTFFKLSSGITSSSFQFSVKDYLAQMDDLRVEVGAEECDPQDWFSTHPFNPMRLKALEVFTRSEPYQRLIGGGGGDLSSDDMETEVTELLSLMEPTYLQESSDAGKKASRFLLAGGFIVAAANGVVERSEVQALASIVGPRVSPEEMRALFDQPVGTVRDEVVELSKDLAALLTGVQKLQLLRDMVVIAYADGSVDKQELACLGWLSNGLGVDPRFIEQILSAARHGVD